MYHGIINVYKEAGFTSHDVVAKLRGICKQKKIGHTGTLDPDAVGVLPVCLGNGTRLCDMLTDRTKEYTAVLRLGITTDTQDISGQILQEKEIIAGREEVRKVILSFQGDMMQIPPMYSALKVDGKKLYELARQGKEIPREPRPITIFSMEIIQDAYPEYTLKISCSKGTYIRTICHDIGQRLGCGGVMVSLCRARVGEFTVDKAHTLTEIEELVHNRRFEEILIPVEKMFGDYSAIMVREEAMKALQNGNQLRRTECESERDAYLPGDREKFRVYSSDSVFYGIYQYEAQKEVYCPVKMFLPEKQA